MLGCVLRATGEKFIPEEALTGISIVPSSTFRKGEAKTRNRVWETSGITVNVSDAEGNDLVQQIRDAVEFMRRNKRDLERLGKASGLEDLRLEFNVDKKKGFKQDTFFPSNLVRLAGEFNIGLEILIYG